MYKWSEFQSLSAKGMWCWKVSAHIVFSFIFCFFKNIYAKFNSHQLAAYSVADVMDSGRCTVGLIYFLAGCRCPANVVFISVVVGLLCQFHSQVIGWKDSSRK